jgi:mannose-6-phosphate isomerase-like protein (cupin superfamily)
VIAAAELPISLTLLLPAAASLPRGWTELKREPIGEDVPMRARRKETATAPPLAGTVLGAGDGAFVVAEWSDDGETSRERPIAPLHVHRSDDEAWYVLEGTLGFQLDDTELVAPAGSAVYAPHGVAHTYWNAGGVRARYLIVLTPNLMRLIDEIHATQSRDADSMRRLFASFDSELL